MYETILLLFILANVMFTTVVALVTNAKINELEECYNDLYNKLKSSE
jgi:hypothetical protein